MISHMKIPSILAVVFLLTPWLQAETTQFLLDDSPEGFLHYRVVEKDGSNQTDSTDDRYLNIKTISEVTVSTMNEEGKAFYRLRVLSQAMGYSKEPIRYYQDFQNKEEATNLMLRIMKLVNAAK